MSSPIIPFPGRHDAHSTEDEDVLRAAGEASVQRAKVEPVTERLIALATELGRALDARQADGSTPKKPES